MALETPLLNGSIRGAYNVSNRLPRVSAEDNQVETPKSSFPAMVKDAAADAVETVREADTAMQAGLRGEIGTQKVVEATMSAEATITTITATRDKLVEAYQQVLRMPI
ncbi:flagellar hook-basal body complex protein FliE [Salipiger mucosus]|uniref:Flagellar basal body protein n=1 Tax=Salipiger mucosus DSM 16094 TaxID=1123237 RepID=S9RVJ5_9RHOB|nr:flagellar hook-basal body complex protein FliE [Salipiger mucosus]EPX77999.1 flagellar basal body protein [Salipiger mucosus DSM 16094]